MNKGLTHLGLFLAEMSNKNTDVNTMSFKCDSCNYKGIISLTKFNLNLGHVWCPNCGEKYWL